MLNFESSEFSLPENNRNLKLGIQHSKFDFQQKSPFPFTERGSYFISKKRF